MTRFFSFFSFALIFFLTANSATAQQKQFDVKAYQDYLDANKNLITSGLLAQHPAPLFKSTVKSNPLTADYLDSIRVKYKLTQDELALLAQNGFVVSERLSSYSFGAAYADIYKKDLPVFITTDAILHALHKSYDDILRVTEKSVLDAKLESSLKNLYTSWKYLDAQYGKNPSMQKMLNDIDVYVTVALNLIGVVTQPNRFENVSTINSILTNVQAEQPGSIQLFSETPRIFDFSQFTPRGHYADEQQLREYFKTMIWLGRTELMLSKPNTPGIPGPTDEDIQRQTIDACLISEAVHRDSTYRLLSEIDQIIKFLVGESDNVTLDNLDMLKQETMITRADQLLVPERLHTFQTILKDKSYAVQRINSQILICDPLAPGSIEPPSAFLLMGQRFVIDSYVMGSVVFDKIDFNGVKVWRPLPSSLDPLHALGNNAAAQLLQDELNKYFYAPNLSALRYLIDSYENEFWNSTLYNTWLQSIRTLNPPNDLSQFPAFMQTGAWWQEKINTQLASWAQLRHDNLLYAKQSYTGGYSCAFPHSYVEPFPEFYQTIGIFAQKAGELYSSKFCFNNNIRVYFERLKNVMDTLTSISQKELNTVPITSEEQAFLKRMLSVTFGCTTVYYGWYTKLFYDNNAVGISDYIIADVHTQPTDEYGNPVGNVLHVGTGDLNLGIITAPCDDGTLTAFVGPMLSYVEHITMNFKRLTDKEWKSMYNQPPSVRPSWVNVYLADKNGNKRAPGPKLITDEATSVEQSIATQRRAITLDQNYPNPFGQSVSSTVIRFEVSSINALVPIHLAVYDVTGKKVRDLVNQKVESGNYFVQWDGKNDGGIDVSSGMYFYRLTAGEQIMMKKIVMMK